jgi:hypothetical protein
MHHILPIGVLVSSFRLSPCLVLVLVYISLDDSCVLYSNPLGYVMTSLASLEPLSPWLWLDRLAMEARLEARLILPDFLRPTISGPSGRCPDKWVTTDQSLKKD